jgi:aldehyde dehydrogenase (NAD+)
VRGDAPIMSEEIFGPILPILTYDRFDECAAYITAHDKPLALYVFGEDRDRIEGLLSSTTAGGTCVNTTILHFANPNLPFGGVGASGIGNYHGFFGFRAFSHERGILRQGRIDVSQFIFPPYSKRVKRVLGWMSKLFA